MPVRYAGGGKDFSIMQYDKAAAAVVLSADMWRELSLTGSWIQDATILRWAELTSRLSKGAIKTSTVVECLLSCIEPERDVAAVRNVYLGMEDKHCVWTDKCRFQRSLAMAAQARWHSRLTGSGFSDAKRKSSCS